MAEWVFQQMQGEKNELDKANLLVFHWEKVDDGGDRPGFHGFPDGSSGGKP